MISLDPKGVSPAGSADAIFRLAAQQQPDVIPSILSLQSDHEGHLIDRWDIIGLLRDLAARGKHPCVIAFAEEDVASWDSATVGNQALRFAHGLQDAGVDCDSRVAIWAPNSAVWVVAALAVRFTPGASRLA